MKRRPAARKPGVELAGDQLARHAHQLLLVLDQAQADLLLRDLGVALDRFGLALDFLIAQVPEGRNDGRQEQQHRGQRRQRGKAVLACAGDWRRHQRPSRRRCPLAGATGAPGRGAHRHGRDYPERAVFRSRNCECRRIDFPQCGINSHDLKMRGALCNTARRSRPSQRPGTRRQPMSALPSNPPANAAAFDTDAQETREWLEALDAVIAAEGKERAHFLLEQLIEEARQNGIDRPFSATTAYVNTIEPVDEERSPGNLEIEGRLRAYMRWNAMAMVVKANRLTRRRRRPGRPHQLVPVAGAHVRRRLQPLLACRRADKARRRPALHPGPQRARHLRPRLPGRPHDRGAAAELPPGGRRQGAVELPAPEADARVLAVPHRQRWAWAR
jgi:hypothetical protein